jgi:hypothetical protein
MAISMSRVRIRFPGDLENAVQAIPTAVTISAPDNFALVEIGRGMRRQQNGE